MRLLLIAALGAAVAGNCAEALEQAGVSAAVRGQVQRASDTQPIGVQVVSGQPIYLADRISSGAQSGMQIMLLDETTFTIGPDSFVKIDEFVYDPSTNVGKVTASLGKGVFRFVTGKIAQQNPSNVTVKLPVATIGVRGTMVYGRSDENSAIVGLAGAGPGNNTGDRPAGIDVITPQGTAEVRRPGWGVSVVRGEPPVVQKLPKSMVGDILSDVAPRDLVNAVTASPGVPNAAPQPPSGVSAASANTASGQSNAAAQPSLATFAVLSTNASIFEAPVIVAAQSPVNLGQTFPDGITTAGQLQSVVTGVATYSQTGIPLLVGGVSRGSYNFSLTVNFATQDLSFNWNNINLPGVANNAVLVGGIGYGNLAPGVAEIIGTSGNCGSDICQGNLTLVNANGILARQAVHSLTLIGANASGGSTAIRQ